MSSFYTLQSSSYINIDNVLNIWYYSRPFRAFEGGTVASWLVRSSPDRAVQVRALVGDIVLCSWTRHFTLIVPLSTQVHKWVLANNGG